MRKQPDEGPIPDPLRHVPIGCFVTGHHCSPLMAPGERSPGALLFSPLHQGVQVFYTLGNSLVSKLFLQRMKVLGITRETLKDWARKHGFFPYEHLEVWGALWGWRVPRERFLIRLALQMGMDPHYVLLSACADRVPAPYRRFFLVIREGLERCPSVVQAWQALDLETQQTLLDLVSQPQQVRCWMKKYRMETQVRPHGAQSPGPRKADQGRLEGAGQGVKGDPPLPKPYPHHGDRNEPDCSAR